MPGLLQVQVSDARQAVRAAEAGADRLVAVRGYDFGLGSPAPDDVAEMRRATTVDLRVLLRLRAGFGTDGGEMTRLKGLLWSYLQAGANGFVFGFLNALGRVDAGVVGELAGAGDWPWTFDQAIDAAFEPDEAWAAVKDLPGLDSVLTAGSARGLEAGFDTLLALARDPELARLIIVDRPAPDQVPWLTRAGLRQVDVGLMGQDVDSDRVASWRRLIA
jgi:copper homeostasis protein